MQISPYSDEFQDYLRDESQMTGFADSISFPRSAAEVRSMQDVLLRDGVTYTLQGARTGLVGGAVPQGGHVMNLSRMARIGPVHRLEDGTGTVQVEPGVTLQELERTLRRENLFWPPRPTEPTATVGGIWATEAQGTNALCFGSSRNYFTAVEKVNDVAVELTLKLLIRPEELWGICFFFETDRNLAQFVERIRRNLPRAEGAAVWSLEYLDRTAIDLIEQRKSQLSAIQEIPDVSNAFCGMIYAELAGSTAGIEALCGQLMEAAADCGSDPDQTWAVSTEVAVGRLNAYRHAAAECCNQCIAEARLRTPKITKLGTDFIFSNLSFGELLALYRRGIADCGLAGVLFGHATKNHLHVNLLPENEEEYIRGVAQIRWWAERCLASGGELAGEHGLGKLKKAWFAGLPG